MFTGRLMVGALALITVSSIACQDGGLESGALFAPQFTVATAEFPSVDIDSVDPSEGTGDCEIGAQEWEEGANVHVAVNGNWIVATCQVQLDAEELAILDAEVGGPFTSAQVYLDFECTVGNDGDPYEGIPANRSHAVVTPDGHVSVTCQAGTPPDPGSFPSVDIDSVDPSEGTGDCEIGTQEWEVGANVHVAVNRNWIVASCQVQLDPGELAILDAVLGGPFTSAQAYRDFACTVGNDGDPYEGVPATRSQAVVTPGGHVSITCQAPIPS
jgi:hypothetical protein